MLGCDPIEADGREILFAVEVEHQTGSGWWQGSPLLPISGV
jgi:hypothetical protein